MVPAVFRATEHQHGAKGSRSDAAQLLVRQRSRAWRCRGWRVTEGDWEFLTGQD